MYVDAERCSHAHFTAPWLQWLHTQLLSHPPPPLIPLTTHRWDDPQCVVHCQKDVPLIPAVELGEVAGQPDILTEEGVLRVLQHVLGEGGVLPFADTAVLASCEGGHGQGNVVKLNHKVGEQIWFFLPAGHDNTEA